MRGTGEQRKKKRKILEPALGTVQPSLFFPLMMLELFPRKPISELVM